jgi:hypothetical protein
MFFGDDKIKFMCDPRMLEVIPKPYPARKYIPDWYKKLSNHWMDKDGYETPTIKRCPPFLDAMSAGWIIPFPADTYVQVFDDGSGIKWKTDFFADTISTHSLNQIETHPKVPTVPVKVLNYWMIQTPPGWSCAFVPPLNRPDDVFDLLSGIVDTDKNFWEYVNFPGFLKAKEGSFKIPSGHPMMQVIPYKRNFNKEAEVRALTPREMQKVQKHRDRHSANFSDYRNNMWEKK